MTIDFALLETELSGALSFINTYTRDVYPMLLTSKLIAPRSFLDSQFQFANVGYFIYTAQLGKVALDAFSATNDSGWLTLAQNIEAAIRAWWTNSPLPASTSDPNWILIDSLVAYGTVEREQITGIDIFGSGVISEDVTFVSGVGSVNSNVSRVIQVFDGDLLYQNQRSPNNGENYKINYWVQNSTRTKTDGRLVGSTGEANGTLVLEDTGFSGTLQVNYTQKAGSTISPPVSANSLQGTISFEPIITDEITEVAINFWWFTAIFDLANQNPSDPDLALLKAFATNRVTNNPLRETVWRYKNDNIINNFFNVTIQGFGASFNNNLGVAEIALTPNDTISIFNASSGAAEVLFINNLNIECASNIDTTLEVKVFTDNQCKQEFSAFIATNTSLTVRNLTFNHFIQVNAGTFKVTSDFVSNGVVTLLEENVNFGVDNVNTSVRQIILTTGQTFETDFNQFGINLPNIIYSLDVDCTVEFTDQAYNNFSTPLNSTGSTYNTFNNTWTGLFGVSDRKTRRVKFTATSNCTLKLWIIGDIPTKLASNQTIYKLEIIDTLNQAHTLSLGKIEAPNNPKDNISYYPGMYATKQANDFTANLQYISGELHLNGIRITNELVGGTLGSFINNVKQFYLDNKTQYQNNFSNPLLYSNFYPYNIENPRVFIEISVNLPGLLIFLTLQAIDVILCQYAFDTFTFRDNIISNDNTDAADVLLGLLDIASFTFSNNDLTFQNLLANFIIWAENQLTGSLPNGFTNIGNTIQSEYRDPGNIALIGHIAIICNLANIERQTAFDIVDYCVNWLNAEYVDSGDMLGSWSDGQASVGSFNEYRPTQRLWATRHRRKRAGMGG